MYASAAATTGAPTRVFVVSQMFGGMGGGGAGEDDPFASMFGGGMFGGMPFGAWPWF